MDVEGTMQLYRLRDAANLKKDSLFEHTSKHLKLLFELPFSTSKNHPEGLALMPCLGEEKALLVVYDSTDKSRMTGKSAIYADAFRLK
jgi:hypothetical protein